MLAGLARANAKQLWYRQCREKGICSGRVRESDPIDFRAIFHLVLQPASSSADAIPRCFEAQGVVSVGVNDEPPNLGERLSWWRCYIRHVEYEPRRQQEQEHVLFAIVHFLGYPPTDNERRPLRDLRVLSPSREHVQWRAGSVRYVDEPCEVTWSIPGHPSASWEARIRRVDADAKKLEVHYIGYPQTQDEWLTTHSPRLRPRQRNRVDTRRILLSR